MYHNVSRGASPSTTTSARDRKVDLENLEDLQDAWCKKNEMLRDPPPPPQLNSPRSLRACAMANVNPQHTLLKLSLKQHLFRVLGNTNMLSALPPQSTTAYKVLMQSALRSFQEATVGIGTSQEKLAAYMAFCSQEELRGSHLASLRELRRQLVAEEVFEERKRHHHHSSRRRSPETGVSGRSSGGGHSRRSERPTEQRGSSQLWSSRMEESARSRHPSVSSLQDSSLLVSGQPQSPASASLRRGNQRKTPPLHRPPTAATAAAAAVAGSPPAPHPLAPARPLVDAPDAFAFSPAATPSGKLPYTPRDVSSLNSSYFGNRSGQSVLSNPPAAPQHSTSVDTSALSPAPRRPALAQKHARHPQPAHAAKDLRSALAAPAADGDRDVSLVETPQNNSVIDGAARQDLSVVSLNSNQLEMLLNPAPLHRSPTPTHNGSSVASPLPPPPLFAASDRIALETAQPAHAVALFHDDGNTAASEAPSKPPPASAATRKQASMASDPVVAGSGSVSSVPLSATSSCPLTPRGRNGYTNSSKPPRQLVPNVVPRDSAAVQSASASENGGQSSPSPSRHNRRDAARAAGGDATEGSKVREESESVHRTAVAAAPVPQNDERQRRHPSFSLPQPLLPAALTQAELEDGFVYYCANPTRSVTKFYGGGRNPIASTVPL